MDKTKFGSREYWGKHLDMCIETIKNDREKLLDLIMDKCIEMEITIPICWGDTPLYIVRVSKSAYTPCFYDEITEGK